MEKIKDLKRNNRKKIQKNYSEISIIMKKMIT